MRRTLFAVERVRPDFLTEPPLAGFAARGLPAFRGAAFADPDVADFAALNGTVDGAFAATFRGAAFAGTWVALVALVAVSAAFAAFAGTFAILAGALAALAPLVGTDLRAGAFTTITAGFGSRTVSTMPSDAA